MKTLLEQLLTFIGFGPSLCSLSWLRHEPNANSPKSRYPSKLDTVRGCDFLEIARIVESRAPHTLNARNGA